MPIDDRRVTLKDIAEKTGFTVNTVSVSYTHLTLPTSDLV